MTTSMLSNHNAAIRASDADREKALDLLRDHWLAGRLALEEYELRCEEATGGCFIDDLRWSIRELPYPLPEHGAAGLTQAPPQPVAPSAPSAPSAPQTKAILSVVFGTIAISIAWVPFLFMLSLPLSTTAWALGRRMRRADRDLVRGDIRTIAIVGEVFGVLGTVIGLLWLTACGFIIGAV